MSLRYDEVMKSIDNYFITRLVLKKHFEKKGMLVSFLPLTREKDVGTGAHAHISLWKRGENISGDITDEY